MIELRSLADDEPALAFSPLLRGFQKTFAYLGEHGSIGLTPSEGLQAGVRALGGTLSSTGQAIPRQISVRQSTRC